MTATLRGKAELDSSRFAAGVRNMQGDVAGFTQKLGAIKGILAGAFSIGAIVSFGRRLISLGSDISDMAAQTGLTTREFQAFEAAAMDAGASMEHVRNGFMSMQRAQSEALNGNQRAREAFQALGLTLEDVARMSSGQLAEALAKGSNAGNYWAQSAIFGARNAGRLQEALQRLAVDGFDEMADAADAAGKVLDARMIERLDRAQDAFKRLGRGIQVWAGNALADFIDGLRLLGVVMGEIFSLEHPMTFFERVNRRLEQEVRAIEEEDARRGQKDKEQRDRDHADRMKQLEELYAKEGQRPQRMPSAPAEIAGRFDSLARIGANVLGSGTNRQVDEARRQREIQIEAMQQTARNTERIARNTDGDTEF